MIVAKHANGRYYAGMTQIGPRFGPLGEAVRFPTSADCARDLPQHFALADVSYVDAEGEERANAPA